MRRFVLTPMAEIAPYFVHPTLHKTVEELLAETTDETSVVRWNPLRPHATFR